MTDYSKMSDFDINCSVANYTMSGECYLPASHPENHTGDIVCNSFIYGEPLPDYCNSWADAGPIIQKNGIAIMPDSPTGDWLAFAEFTLCEGEWEFESEPTNHVAGSNPLRAAMIVFLMMNEGE